MPRLPNRGQPAIGMRGEDRGMDIRTAAHRRSVAQVSGNRLDCPDDDALLRPL